MIAEFSISPMDSVHISRDLAHLVEVLDESGLAYRLGPMGTCVEGNWDEVLEAIRRCHQSMTGRHERVLTTVVIDDRKTHPHRLADMVNCVEEHLRSRATRAEVDSEC